MPNPHARLWTLGLLSTSLLIGGALEFGSHASASGQRTLGRNAAKPLRQAAPTIRLDLETYAIEAIALPEGNPLEARVVVPTAEGPIALDLHRHSVRSGSFTVFEDRGDGSLHRVEPPPVRTYRGIVEGDPESTVFASIDQGRLWAVVQRPDRPDLVVEPVDPLATSKGRDLAHLVFAADAVRPDGRGCGNDFFDLDAHGTGGIEGMGGDGGVAGTALYLVEVGIDSDFEFFQKNGSSVANTVNDIENIMNGVDTVYRRDVGIIYEISTIIVRSSSSDPYSSNNIETVLCEFGSTWNSAPENAILRDVAQMFTGKSMGSTIGLAWLGVVCNQTGAGCGTFGNLAYSVVESRYTTSYNLRVSLSAHELGHNWNASHCSGSTCHIMCASNNGCGGVTGGNLKFGPTSISTITSYRNQLSCDTLLPPPLELPFLDQFVSTSVSSSNWIYRKNASTSSLSVNPPSSPRALLLDAAGNGEYQDDEVRSNFIPLDGYVQDVVEVSYWTQHRGPEAGEKLVVEYLSFSNDWLLLNEVVSDGSVQDVFEQHRHVLPQNSKHDEFRIRFRTQVDETNDDWFIDDIQVAVVPPVPAPENDECTGALGVAAGTTNFSTVGATDSGPLMPAACGEGGPWEMRSDVWFTYQADCTGLLEVETCGSSFDTYLAVYGGSLCPGENAVPLVCSQNFPLCGTGSKVFLEVAAGASFVIRIGSPLADTAGEGLLTITCTGDGPACPTDLDGNGFTDGADLAALLGSWGDCVGCAADIDGNDLVNGADLAALLGGWGACP